MPYVKGGGSTIGESWSLKRPASGGLVEKMDTLSRGWPGLQIISTSADIGAVLVHLICHCRASCCPGWWELRPNTMAEPATTQTKGRLKRASQRKSPNENNGACHRTDHSRDPERARKIPSRGSINRHYRRIFPMSPRLWQCVITRAVGSSQRQINIGSFEVRQFQKPLASVFLNISGAFPYK